MSPTCSSRFFVGKNALSATARTNYPPLSGSKSTAPTPPLRKEMQPKNVVPWMKLVHVSGARPRWYLSRAVASRAHRVVPVAFACAGLLVTGCGGGGERQDKNEPTGNYRVQIVQAKFPDKQSLAKRSQLVIAVKNVDTKTIPNVAVTVKSFDQRSNDPTLADPRRPLFVVNTGPRGGDTAYVGTSALGPLKPGHVKVFKWDVTAVKAGPYNLRYAVSAGLAGKAKAVLAGGGKPAGTFTGEISNKAPQAHVADNGKTVVTSGG
jgi:hypothetical protein